VPVGDPFRMSAPGISRSSAGRAQRLGCESILPCVQEGPLPALVHRIAPPASTARIYLTRHRHDQEGRPEAHRSPPHTAHPDDLRSLIAVSSRALLSAHSRAQPGIYPSPPTFEPVPMSHARMTTGT
jgi:hypothetical protein